MQHNNDIYFERRITTIEIEYKKLNEKIDTLATKQEIKDLALITKQELREVESNLNHKIDKLALLLNHNIDRAINKSIWKLGSLIIGWITLYPFIVTYFSKLTNH